MAEECLQIIAHTPDQEATIAALSHWCQKHDVSANMFMLTILPKIVFCLNNYTVLDKFGEPMVTLNLYETRIPTKQTVARRARRKARYRGRSWDSAF